VRPSLGRGGPRGSQISVQLGHDRGPFADRGAYALDRAGTYVTDGEHTSAVRFQCMTFLTVILPCADKPLLVQSHIALRKPVRIRIGADEKEQMTYRVRRINARMMRSSSSASCTKRSRSLSDRMTRA
jgi:hypothetical protein